MLKLQVHRWKNYVHSKSGLEISKTSRAIIGSKETCTYTSWRISRRQRRTIYTFHFHFTSLLLYLSVTGASPITFKLFLSVMTYLRFPFASLQSYTWSRLWRYLTICTSSCTSYWAIQLSLWKYAYSNILNISPPKAESFLIKILVFIFLLRT